jgi:hypothetical protein
VLVIVAVAVDFLVLLLGFVLSPIQEHRETARGYTTLSGAHQQLPQVAPGTTSIIRAAGAEFLARTR